MPTQKRQVAMKVRIKDILEGSYVKEEGWEPNYVQLLDSRKCSRSNVIAVVIEIPESTDVGYDHFTLDDGSGSILVRTFDQTQFLQGLSIGDVVLLIGRPREYQSNKYIVPEIVRKIDNHKWVEVRKKELEAIEKSHPRVEKPVEMAAAPEEQVTKQAEAPEEAAPEPVAETPVSVKQPAEEAPELPKDPYQEVVAMIRELDKGDGADIEELTSMAKVQNADTIVEALLREGEIFELRPGKLKVLE